jgi:hypothetical protein
MFTRVRICAIWSDNPLSKASTVILLCFALSKNILSISEPLLLCCPLGLNKHHAEWNTDTNISTGQEKEKNRGHRYKKTEKTGDDLKN